VLAKEAYIKGFLYFLRHMPCLPTYVYCCILTYVQLQTSCAKEIVYLFTVELIKEELKP